MELNETELINYIYGKLIEKGITVAHDDIFLILDLEVEYMIENGFAVAVDDE